MTDPFQSIPTEALEAELARRQESSGEPITPAQARKLTPAQANKLWNERIRRELGHAPEGGGS